MATAFSCLATLDADHSFVPRWKPPFISALAPGDRCHLNGLAVVDDQRRYVTALGRTDEPGGWRAGKAHGGVHDRRAPRTRWSSRGLSMPHSPRWHDGRLWVLESGQGELCMVDLDDGPHGDRRRAARLHARAGVRGRHGVRRPVADPRVLDLRRPAAHPAAARSASAASGWSTSARGEIEGFLRFDDLVQEVFDVALLPGTRYPEIAEPGSSAVATAFELP